MANIHSEETEKSMREVINGPGFTEDGNVNMEQYLENVSQENYAYSEDDGEFIEQRIFLRERMEFPEWGTDYEPYRF